MTTTTDPTLATIVEKSPELLEAAGLIYTGKCWIDETVKDLEDYDVAYIDAHRAESLLSWAIIKILAEKGFNPRVLGGITKQVVELQHDEIEQDSRLRFYGGDTMLAALYAAYLAARDKA